VICLQRDDKTRNLQDCSKTTAALLHVIKILICTWSIILQDVRVQKNESYEIRYDKSFSVYLHTVGTGKQCSNASGVTNMSGSPTSLLEFDSTERRKIQHHHHPGILRFCLLFQIILVRYVEQSGIAKTSNENFIFEFPCITSL
jgi:hypothetical protein